VAGEEAIENEETFKMSRRWVVLLLACLAVSLILLAYPMYVIRPFRAQGARELMAALMVSRIGPMLTVVSAIVAIAAAIAYWRTRPQMGRRRLAAASAVLVCVLAVLARVNVYEAVMFHAVEHPEFATVADTKIDPNDKLIVVKIGGSARAYPIREMGYHHVVNDVVGGTALVATY
jgi:Protein of unknown function (DUF3179)